jgi:hypothetical protein
MPTETDARIRGRRVHVRKGQSILIDAGPGVQLALTKYPAGEVELRNLKSGNLLRQWSPKEARER